MTEIPFTFSCEGSRLVGIVHTAAGRPVRGVLVVVGGPQYRVGAHRQFTLLARALAEGGFPAMRFDYRGMGDSEGEARDFEEIGDDLRAAIDAFVEHVPSIEEVAIWGLCDGAAAAVLYACDDPRVVGVTMVNPWVIDEETEEWTIAKHYYLRRLASRELWSQILRGELNVVRSAAAVVGKIARYVGTRARRTARRPLSQGSGSDSDRSTPLPGRMLHALNRFHGRILLILCGNDHTSHVFKEHLAVSPKWRKRFRGEDVTRLEIPDADHTVSRRDWQTTTEVQTLEWLRSW